MSAEKTRVASLEITKLLTYVNFFAAGGGRGRLKRLTPLRQPTQYFSRWWMPWQWGMWPQAQKKCFHETAGKPTTPGQLFWHGGATVPFADPGPRNFWMMGETFKQAMKEIEEMKSKFVADKGPASGAAFLRWPDLEAIYHRLLRLDSDVKQGVMSL